MYLIQITKPIELLLFLESDPRQDGFDGEVKEGVTLEDRLSNDFPDGGTMPTHYLGISRDNNNEYRVFGSVNDCYGAGFRHIPSNFTSHFASYAEFLSRAGQ